MRALYQRTFLFLIFLIITLQASTQIDVAAIDSLTSRITRQMQMFPQEKLHIHNDKSVYISGEKVWFRAHLVEAISHKYDTTSLYVYGELINPMDSVVNRVKIKNTKGVYGGHFLLDEDYPAGVYTMRFYTRFLENLEEGYFFTKTIDIGGPFSAKYEVKLDCGYRNNNKNLDVALEFFNQETEEKIIPEKIFIGTNKRDLGGFEKENLKQIKLDKEDKVSESFNVSKEPIRSLYVEFEYDGDFYSEFIPVPAASDDFHVDFFPEGGDLLIDVPMNIGFKALRSDGFSEKVTGIVYAENGDSIATFTTIHQGMGVFPFWATASTKYYAICKTEDGKEKKFQLPESKEIGYSLSVQETRSNVVISVTTSGKKEIADDLMLLIHTKGQIIYLDHWDKGTETIGISKDELPAGVLQLMLVDNDYQPISERLFFNITDDYYPVIEQKTNKDKYIKRDLVVSSLRFSDADGTPLNGSFSVSVTDDKDITVDSTQNILTTLLLTSELKGYIENPSFYFQNSRIATYALDLLMLTQGWRRYNMTNVFNGDIETPSIPLEFVHEIKGKVQSGILMNRKSKNSPVLLLDLASSNTLTTTTDEEGQFVFQSIFPDSLNLVIRATTEKEGNRLDLQLEEELFPRFTSVIPKKPAELNLINKYLEKADLKYTLENGMRLISLKEVEVVGSKKRSEAKRSSYTSAINTVYDEDNFKRLGARDLKDVLNRLPSVRVDVQGRVFIRNSESEALIMVNDVESESIISENPPVESIESVEIVKDGGLAFFGSRASNGAILIMLKIGSQGQNRVFNLKRVNPLGFQAYAEFYSPKYETRAEKQDPISDLRSTLYWNPNVNIVDGEAEVRFYTADEASQYSIFIDGVSSDGKPLHLINKIGEKKE